MAKVEALLHEFQKSTICLEPKLHIVRQALTSDETGQLMHRH